MADFKVKWYGADGQAQGYVSFDVLERGMSAEDRLKICMAGARVLLDRLRAWLGINTNDRNKAVRGALARSLQADAGHDGAVIVGPKGKHHGGASAVRTRAAGYHRAKTGTGDFSYGRDRRKRHGLSSGATTAQEVGYYLEYGTPRMEATHWMETVCEQSNDEVLAAMQVAWDDYLKTKGF